MSDSESRKGLFILKNYTPDVHGSGSEYWLASPYGLAMSTVYMVAFDGGTIKNLESSRTGVRPVISMTNVKMQKKSDNNHVWEIVD